MTIVNPNFTTNTIKVTPRYYDYVGVNLTFEIQNEDKRVLQTAVYDTILKVNGQLSFNVTAIFANNVSYSLKITDIDLNTVIYRGLIFATPQDLQNYKINE